MPPPFGADPLAMVMPEIVSVFPAATSTTSPLLPPLIVGPGPCNIVVLPALKVSGPLVSVMVWTVGSKVIVSVPAQTPIALRKVFDPESLGLVTLAVQSARATIGARTIARTVKQIRVVRRRLLPTPSTSKRSDVAVRITQILESAFIGVGTH